MKSAFLKIDMDRIKGCVLGSLGESNLLLRAEWRGWGRCYGRCSCGRDDIDAGIIEAKENIQVIEGALLEIWDDVIARGGISRREPFSRRAAWREVR